MRLLFVCLGNICRSPTGEGVMRALIREEGLEGRVEVDSAGTGSWHIGEAPDQRAVAAARRRDIVLAGRARRVEATDFERFDLLLAADRSNAAELRRLAPDDAAGEKVRLLREFDPVAREAGDLEVPDPYYGADGGFEEVLDIVEAACRGLLAEVRARDAT